MTDRHSGIFYKAVAIEDDAQREAYLQESCGDDPALLERVKELLDAAGDDNESLFRPFAALPRDEDELPEMAQLELPRDFGNYRLEEKIGEGGMGVIYRAIQLDLQRVVALKMIRNAQLATQSEIKRFYAEARSAAALNHPGIVPVIESGKVGEQHFFSMGFIEGINLAELLKEHAISLEQIVNITKEIAAAVHYAHEKGVVHRDLKPENILISPRNTEPNSPNHFQPHITDFGLAKRQEHDPGLTIAGEILGTPGYMSPEQAEGGEDVNESTDVYAIGALFYFMLTKHAPFEGDSVLETLEKVRTSEPERPTTVRPFIPGELETITLKCLEKEPRNRYPSAAELVIDLENHQHGRPLLAKPTGQFIRFIKFCKRKPLIALSSVLGVMLVISLIVFPFLLKLSDEKLAQENLATKFAQEQAAQQKAASELIKANQSVISGKHRQALQEFINTARLAREAEDPETETSARWGIADSSARLWPKVGSFSSQAKVWKMALSPDARFLAALSSSQDDPNSPKIHGLEIFDLTSQKLLYRDTSKTEHKDLSFHPESHSLLVATGQEGIKILRFTEEKFFLEQEVQATFKDIKPTRHHSIGYLRNGRLFFASGFVPRIGVWDLEDEMNFKGIIQAEGHLNGAAISTVSDLIVAISPHQHLYGWNSFSRERLFGPIELGFIPSQIAINRDGTQVALASEEGKLSRLYDISSLSTETTELPPFQTIEFGVPKQFQFGFKTSALFHLTELGSLRVRKSPTARDKAVPISRKDVVSFAISEDESTLVTSHANSKELLVWKSSPFWRNEFTLPASSHGRYHTTGFNQNMLIGGEFKVRVFPSPKEQLESKTILGEKLKQDIAGVPLSIIGSHSKKYLYVLGRHNEALYLTRVTKDRGWHKWNELVPLKEPIEMIFDHDEQRIVCLSRSPLEEDTPNVSIINLEKRSWKEFTIPGQRLLALANSTGKSDEVVLASSPDKLTWLDISSGEITRELSLSRKDVVSMTSSREAGLLALGYQNGTVLIIDESSGETIQSLSYDESATLLGFGAQGQLIVTGGNENTATIREVSTGRSIGNGLSHDGKIVDLDVCDDTRSIITATADGQIKVWPIPTKDDRDIETIREEAKKLLLIAK